MTLVSAGLQGMVRSRRQLKDDAWGKQLAQHELRVVTAESCTGGLLAASIAEVPGSSSVLEGSFVTYSPSMKAAALGVSTRLIEERTVYDPKVAEQMATGALEAAPEVGLALAITGVGGPDDDQGKPADMSASQLACEETRLSYRSFSFQGVRRLCWLLLHAPHWRWAYHCSEKTETGVPKRIEKIGKV